MTLLSDEVSMEASTKSEAKKPGQSDTSLVYQRILKVLWATRNSLLEQLGQRNPSISPSSTMTAAAAVAVKTPPPLLLPASFVARGVLDLAV